MFLRKLIPVCLAFALLAPLAEAKKPKAPKIQKNHNSKFKQNSRVQRQKPWGSHKVKMKHGKPT
jgi:hypothetical protein